MSKGLIKVTTEPQMVAYGIGTKHGFEYDVPIDEFYCDDVFGSVTFHVGDNSITIDHETLKQLITVLQSIDQELSSSNKSDKE